nr:DNA mismatch repair endonuclease MutL [Leptolyngbyaceae cyanobacterium MO_188.B28]
PHPPIPIPGLPLGNLFIGIQPSRGYDQDPALNYHAPDLEPTHDYLAFYRWIRQDFGAHAIIHVGKHGNLEWLPGKGVALSDTCYPEVALGPLPHLYPFIVNDPGEGAQAKRRAQAVILDHLTPPMTRAELYGPLQQLEALVDEYYEAQTLDPRRLLLIRDRITTLVLRENLHQDLGIAGWEGRGDGEDGEENPIQNPKSKIQNPLIQNRLSLVLGLPDRCHRRRPDWVLVGLNGRPVQAPELEQAMIGAFRRTLPRDRFPVCFLNLQAAPEQIDWNRHPAKSEIYLHHLDNWRAQIAQAVDHALRLAPESLSNDAHTSRIGQVLKAAEADGVYGAHRTIPSSLSPTISEHLESTAPSSSTNSNSPSLRAIAQVHSMYILAEQSAGICLIEQHIAHERVLYEQLCDRWQVVALESPVILKNLSIAQVEQLKRIGLEVDPFGERLWAIRTAPASLSRRQDCAEALLELSLGGDLQAALVATACRTAIRNGAPLTLTEMQTLLNQWRQTRNPRTCPHGRPICLTLEESSLSRFFRRHWVIGKSHGI